MKIQAYYYLDFPVAGPDEPLIATSRMRFEVANDTAMPDDLIGIYEVRVMTYQYIAQEIIATNANLICGPIVIVPTMEDKWMSEFLAANIDKLLDFADDVS